MWWSAVKEEEEGEEEKKSGPAWEFGGEEKRKKYGKMSGWGAGGKKKNEGGREAGEKPGTPPKKIRGRSFLFWESGRGKKEKNVKNQQRERRAAEWRENQLGEGRPIGKWRKKKIIKKGKKS